MPATFETLLNALVSQIQTYINTPLQALGLDPIPDELVAAGPPTLTADSSIFVTYTGMDRINQHQAYRDCVAHYEIHIFRLGPDEAQLQIDAGKTEAALVYALDQDRTLGGLTKSGGIWPGDSEGQYGRSREGVMAYGLVLPVRITIKVSRPDFEV